MKNLSQRIDLGQCAAICAVCIFTLRRIYASSARVRTDLPHFPLRRSYTLRPCIRCSSKTRRSCDEGKSISCYANNLWDIVDSSMYEANLEETDVSSLECWGQSHQTHIDIFGGFLIYARTLNDVPDSRLFHKIHVLESNQQAFGYVGGHEETGTLNAR